MPRQKKEKIQTEVAIAPKKSVQKSVRKRVSPVVEPSIQKISPQSIPSQTNYLPHLLLLGVIIVLLSFILFTPGITAQKNLPTTSKNITAISIYNRQLDRNKNPWVTNQDGSDYANFPQQSVVVATDQGIDVIDYASSSLYFHCSLPGVSLASRDTVTLLSKEGRIFVGVKGTGVFGIDFAKDQVFRISSKGYFRASSVKNVCKDISLLTLQKDTTTLFDDAVQSLAQVTRDNHQYVAIGTQTGITLLDAEELSTWQIINNSSGTTKLAFDVTGALYIAQIESMIIDVVKTVFTQLKGPTQELASISSYSYTLRGKIGDELTRIQTFVLDTNGSMVTSGENSLWVGTENGLVYLQENEKHSFDENVVVFAKPYSLINTFRQFNVLEGNHITHVVLGDEVLVVTNDEVGSPMLQKIDLQSKTELSKKKLQPITFFERINATSFLVGSSSSGVTVKTIENL